MAKTKGKEKVGRPSKYIPEYAAQAKKLCLLKRGLKNAEIAAFFGVSTTTLDSWQKNHPEFKDALKEGRDFADAEVANSLYEQALGGNVTAAIFWLKNRQAQSWRDVKQSENVTYEATAEDRMWAAAYKMGLSEYLEAKSSGTLPPEPKLPGAEPAVH